MFFLRFVLFFLSLLALTGCSHSGKRADLVLITGAEPESLDPALVTGEVDQHLVSELFEGLTRFNAAGIAQPGMASSWELSSNQCVYTFHLRSDAFWSNGVPVVASDFVTSWKRILMPMTGAPYSYQLFMIQGAELFASGKEADFSKVGIHALDKHTLEVILDHPVPYFLELCATPPFFPVPIDLIDQVGDNWIKPHSIISNGPYCLTAWNINDKITLQLNLKYWDASHVFLKTIDLLPITQATTAYNFYATGAADIIFGKLIPLMVMEELKKKSDFHKAPFLGCEFFRFNCSKGPFQDARVRKAFALTIDRDRVVRKITHAGEIPATSLVPPGIQGYDSPKGLSYDPELARQLLVEAGYPGGKGFPLISYLYNEGELTEGIGIELQATWKKELGISVLLSRREWKSYLSSMNTLDYNIGRSSWVGDYPDPDTFLNLFTSNSGNNRTGWTSSYYDHLMEAASLHPEKRFLFFQKAESFLIEEQAVIAPLFYYVGIQIFDPHHWGGIQGNILDKHPLREIYRK